MTTHAQIITRFAAQLPDRWTRPTAADYRAAGGSVLSRDLQAIEEAWGRIQRLRQLRQQQQLLNPTIPLRERARRWRRQKLDATALRQGAQYGRYRVTIQTEEHEDWNRYSKEWHRNHGPARTTTTTAVIQWITGSAARPTIQEHRVRIARRNDHKTIWATCAKLAGWRRHTGRLALRIQPWVALRRMKSPRRGVTVWGRWLDGRYLGCVATQRGQHYHVDSPPGRQQPAADAHEATRGLRRKLAKVRHRRIYGLTSRIKTTCSIRSALMSLGFCRPGVEDALSILGLDPDVRLEDLGARDLQDLDPRDLQAVVARYPAEAATLRQHAPKRILETLGID